MNLQGKQLKTRSYTLNVTGTGPMELVNEKTDADIGRVVGAALFSETDISAAIINRLEIAGKPFIWNTPADVMLINASRVAIHDAYPFEIEVKESYIIFQYTDAAYTTDYTVKVMIFGFEQ